MADDADVVERLRAELRQVQARYAEAQDENLTLCQSRGAGSTFTVLLPVVVAEDE